MKNYAAYGKLIVQPKMIYKILFHAMNQVLMLLSKYNEKKPGSLSHDTGDWKGYWNGWKRNSTTRKFFSNLMSVMVVYLRAENLMRQRPNTKQEYQPFNREFCSI
jgi:hypothetical protein